MNKGMVSSLLEKQKAEDVVEKAMGNSELLEALFTGVSSTNPRVRFRSAKALRMISEKNPRKLYPRMDFFVKLLDSKNTILKWIAMDVIANLAAVDTRNEFNRLLDKFYSYLREGSLITAAHVVDNSGKIALAKPELQSRITQELLKVEEVSLPTQECKNILTGKAITAFSVYYNEIGDKDEVIAFVKRQLNNSRNATRNKAEKLLAKLGTS